MTKPIIPLPDGIKTVVFGTGDINGVMRGKRIPAAHWDTICEDGCAIIAAIYAVLLHKTNFGRAVYAIGNNATGAMFSGIRVQRVKFTLFLLTGLMSGIAAICLTARLGSTRPSIATGWELEIITMVVLGGVSILGGSGTIVGVVIAAFVKRRESGAIA